MHRCHVRGIGIDCALLIRESFRQIRNDLSKAIPFYSADFMLHKASSEELFLREVEKLCVGVSSPLRGDIVMFHIGRCFSHGGIMLSPREFVHAQLGRGVTKSYLDDKLWSKKRRKFMRVKEWAI